MAIVTGFYNEGHFNNGFCLCVVHATSTTDFVIQIALLVGTVQWKSQEIWVQTFNESGTRTKCTVCYYFCVWCDDYLEVLRVTVVIP